MSQSATRPVAATHAVELIAAALSEHANGALLLLSAARSVLDPEGSITSDEQIGAAIGAVRTAASGLMIGDIATDRQAELLNAAADLLADEAPLGDCGAPLCLPSTAAAAVAHSSRVARSAWTHETVMAGLKNPDAIKRIPVAELTAWALDIAATTSLARRDIPVVAGANGELLRLVRLDSQAADEDTELLQSLLYSLVDGEDPAALSTRGAEEAWPFSMHPQTWARAGVLRSSIEAASEAFLRTSRAVRLTHAAALSDTDEWPVGVFPRGMFEEVYEGAAFGWIWASVVLVATPDREFVHACGAVIDGTWANSVADAATAAVRNWVTAGQHADECPDLDEDLAGMRRMLAHIARHVLDPEYCDHH